jgi:hypothetical protein
VRKFLPPPGFDPRTVQPVAIHNLHATRKLIIQDDFVITCSELESPRSSKMKPETSYKHVVANTAAEKGKQEVTSYFRSVFTYYIYRISKQQLLNDDDKTLQKSLTMLFV